MRGGPAGRSGVPGRSRGARGRAGRFSGPGGPGHGRPGGNESALGMVIGILLSRSWRPELRGAGARRPGGGATSARRDRPSGGASCNRQLIWLPIAAAYRSRVEARTSASPASSRATADCEVPIRAATWVWDSPAACRCAVSSVTRRRRSPAIRRSAISRNPGSRGSSARPAPPAPGPSGPSCPHDISPTRYRHRDTPLAQLSSAYAIPAQHQRNSLDMTRSPSHTGPSRPHGTRQGPPGRSDPSFSRSISGVMCQKSTGIMKVAANHPGAEALVRRPRRSTARTPA